MGALAGPIIGAVGSVAASAMSDKGEPSQASSEPWSAVQPYLQQLYQSASGLLQNNGGSFPYYPGSTVASRSPITQASQQTMLDRIGQAGIFGQGYAPASNMMQSLMSSFNPALMGFNDFAGGGFGPSSTMPGNAAISSLMPTAQGEMLGNNPYLDSMFQGAASQVGDQFRTQTMPALQSMFAQAGRYGPGSSMTNAVDLQNQGFGQTLNRLASGIYGQNYANERQNQMNAAQQLGALGTSDIEAQLRGLTGLQQSGQYDTQNMLQILPMLMNSMNQDLGAMSGIGNADQAYNQQLTDADRQRWDFMTQQSGFLPLQQFSSLIGSPMQQTSTGARDPGKSIFDQIIGGAGFGDAIQDIWNQRNIAPPSNYGLNPFATNPDSTSSNFGDMYPGFWN